MFPRILPKKSLWSLGCILPNNILVGVLARLWPACDGFLWYLLSIGVVDNTDSDNSIQYQTYIRIDLCYEFPGGDFFYYLEPKPARQVFFPFPFS